MESVNGKSPDLVPKEEKVGDNIVSVALESVKFEPGALVPMEEKGRDENASLDFSGSKTMHIDCLKGGCLAPLRHCIDVPLSLSLFGPNAWKTESSGTGITLLQTGTNNIEGNEIENLRKVGVQSTEMAYSREAQYGEHSLTQNGIGEYLESPEHREICQTNTTIVRPDESRQIVVRYLNRTFSFRPISLWLNCVPQGEVPKLMMGRAAHGVAQKGTLQKVSKHDKLKQKQYEEIDERVVPAPIALFKEDTKKKHHVSKGKESKIGKKRSEHAEKIKKLNTLMDKKGNSKGRINKVSHPSGRIDLSLLLKPLKKGKSLQENVQKVQEKTSGNLSAFKSKEKKKEHRQQKTTAKRDDYHNAPRNENSHDSPKEKKKHRRRHRSLSKGKDQSPAKVKHQKSPEKNKGRSKSKKEKMVQKEVLTIEEQIQRKAQQIRERSDDWQRKIKERREKQEQMEKERQKSLQEEKRRRAETVEQEKRLKSKQVEMLNNLQVMNKEELMKDHKEAWLQERDQYLLDQKMKEEERIKRDYEKRKLEADWRRKQKEEEQDRAQREYEKEWKRRVEETKMKQQQKVEEQRERLRKLNEKRLRQLQEEQEKEKVLQNGRIMEEDTDFVADILVNSDDDENGLELHADGEAEDLFPPDDDNKVGSVTPVKFRRLN